MNHDFRILSQWICVHQWRLKNHGNSTLKVLILLHLRGEGALLNYMEELEEEKSELKKKVPTQVKITEITTLVIFDTYHFKEALPTMALMMDAYFDEWCEELKKR